MGHGFQEATGLGLMASVIEHSLLVVLSSLLVAGGYGFPSLRLLFQDGVAGDNPKAHSLHAKSPLVATGRWEWKTSGEAGHESTPLPRRKRDVVPSTESSLKATTLLEDETDRPSVEPTTEQLEEDETSQPGLAGNSSSAEATATSSSLTDTSTEAAVVRLSTVRAKVPPRGQTTTASLSEDFTETEGAKDGGRPSHTTDTTRPRTSTAPSQALVATSATSAATLGPDSKSGVKTVGGTNASLSPSTASSRPSSTVRASPPSREAPSGLDSDKMVGQCLLAISLLALVAAIFIITTFVLIALLLRQKRAYKLRRRDHTEMVCISSLLAAEEAEASGGRAPRAKRVKMLAENGSETDMDNLTLNSFLPDH
ncbi:UNVERIFIED_CONTAM: hypothetical protein K2H54_003934 [Gekko kuhli]